MVTIPIPPICIRVRITAWPKNDQYEKVSCTTNPVTHAADTEVNSASLKDADWPDADAQGSMSSRQPAKITDKNPKLIS